METTETNGTGTSLVKCPVPECGKEFKGNSGLSSHMIMAHHMDRFGNPLPEGKVEKQKANLAQAVKASNKTRHDIAKKTPHLEVAKNGQNLTHLRDPEVRKKAGESIRKRSLMKMAERGIHRCPNCLEKNLKVDFSTAQQLGLHRRTEHGIVGQQAEKTARRTEQLRLEREAARTSPDNVVTEKAKKYVPQLPFKCDLCPPDKPRTFRNQHGLSIHLSQAHKDSTTTALSPLTSSQELVHANGSTKRRTVSSVVPPEGTSGQRHPHASNSHDAEIIKTLAIHNLGREFEGLIGRASLEYDFPPRQFAQWCLLFLAERYS
jgi:uncharacterized C2H2 Zn-finger protein